MLSFLKELHREQQSRLIRVTFVCTANCCRSPMAEILFEKRLRRDGGGYPPHLLIESAGTLYSGYPMSAKARELLVLQEGISEKRCRAHMGRLLTEIEEPDLILTMTEEHVKQIYLQNPEWDDKTFTLDEFVKFDRQEEVRDIIDPIGGTLKEFQLIKEQIKSDLQLLYREFQAAGLCG